MRLWVAAAAFILATPAPGSNCGWTGLVLAPPDVEVRGPDVGLERPLRIVDIEAGSPAEEAGMKPGMEILSLDSQYWDESGFLPNLVRLQTVGPGETLRIVSRDGSAEPSFHLEAEPCSAAQARQRARTLANLGRMEGALRARDDRRSSEAREMYENALREHEAARRHLEDRLNDPQMQEQIAVTMAEAQEALRAAQEGMEDEDWRREMEASMRQVREAMQDQDVRREVEESLRHVRDSEREIQAALESARGAGLDEARRRDIERALFETRVKIHDDEWRAAMEKSLRRAQEELTDQDTQRQMERAMAEVRESQLATGRLLEDLQVALPDEEARFQLQRAMEQAQEAMQGDEWRRQLEQSLRSAEERLDQSRSREVEMQLVQEQMRRALQDAGQGREARRRALLEASEAARFISDAGVVFGGALFQRIEPGIARHVDVDHGVLVMNLELGSPLAEAGVEAGDVILAVDGRQVEDVEDLFEQAARRVEDLDRGDDDALLEIELHTPDGLKTVEVPLTPDRSGIL